MGTRKKAVEELPLPAQDALPPSAFDHPTLHMIINAYASGSGKKSGSSKKALVTKFKLPLAYINAVIYEYLEKYDT